MKTDLGVVVLVVIALCTSGCSTVVMRSHSENSGRLDYYPATRYDLWTIKTGGGMIAHGDCDNGVGPVVGWCVVVPLHILDIPVSLVTDTLFLPSDILSKRNEDQETSNKPTGGDVQ